MAKYLKNCPKIIICYTLYKQTCQNKLNDFKSERNYFDDIKKPYSLFKFYMRLYGNM